MSEHHPHHSEPENRLPLGTFILRIALALFIMGILVAYSMTFQVPEGTNVVVTRFENPIRTVSEPGLHFRLPWPIDRANVVDMRRRIANTQPVQILTNDTKSLILVCYTIWQVRDPLLFRKSLGTIEDAEKSLTISTVDKVNLVMRKHAFDAIISTDPNTIRVAEIESEICREIHAEVSDKFGVDIIQVGIKRISFSETNVTAILDHMAAEREAQAGKLRAEGQKDAEEILNRSKVESADIIKEGTLEAGRITGEANVEAARIRSEAQALDPKFYEFWRTLIALRNTIGPRTTLILRNDAGIFKPIFEMPDLDSWGQNPTPAALTTPGVSVPAITPEAAQNAIQALNPAAAAPVSNPVPAPAPAPAQN